MKKKRILIILIFLIIIFTDLAVNLNAEQKKGTIRIRRFAMVICSNYGGPDRTKLQYAVSDAKAMIKILEGIGGVMSDDSKMLIEPNREAFFWEINRLKNKVERAKQESGKVEVIIYYSGHSDEKNLLLGNEKLAYAELLEQINEIESDVRIAILDSCASGAFTRLKGGKMRSPFLLDSAYNMKGNAFMTSSSSNESSQESERLKGSFFTHNLLTGMRGAADLRKDGRVTLSEAYQYAFNETLEQTEKTINGPQHPNYHIQMSGTGDVVMTEYRKNTALLKISKNISGRIFIHNAANLLVLELNKPYGREIELGLEHGKYRLINIFEGIVFETRVFLEKGKYFELLPNKLVKVKKVDAVARGDLQAKLKKSVVLRKKKGKLFAEIITKMTVTSGIAAVYGGAQIGLSFDQRFYVGIGGYGKTNFPFPGIPGYGGVIFGYSIKPWKKIHFNVGAMLGAGVGPTEELNDNFSGIFYILEPEIKMVLNLSKTVRIRTGVSIPILDRKIYGLENPTFMLSFQFGK
jgi:hypothetical protein